MKILFVCLGNTCRSPIAEGIARELIGKTGLSWDVSSAGTMDLGGEPASRNAVKVCGESGIDISGHRSRIITAAMIRDADFVFGMENAHIDYARRLAPEAFRHIFLLGGFGPNADAKEIPDPVGANIATFRIVMSTIRQEIERILPHIEQMA